MKSLLLLLLLIVPIHARSKSSDALWKPDPELKTYEVVVGDSFEKQRSNLEWPKDEDGYYETQIIEKPHNIRMKFGEKFYTLYSHVTAVSQRDGIIRQVVLFPLRKELKYYEAVDEYAKILEFLNLAQTKIGKEAIKSYRESFAINNFPRFKLSPQIYLEPSLPTRSGKFPTPLDALFAVKLEVIRTTVFDNVED